MADQNTKEESDSSGWSSENEKQDVPETEAPSTKGKQNKGASKTGLTNKGKKKKPKVILVCLTNCRYDVIRRTAQKFQFKEVGEGETWNMYWTDLSITIERCKDMKRYQKINHFPGMLEICRKDLLARNLNRMLRLYPKEYNFFPKTWCFPADLGEALTYSRLRKNKTFILKPDTGSQGRGIVITKSLKDVRPYDKGICQVYLTRPYLIDGYKFDLRVYVLITSCEPLRVYIYNEGLVRFATSRYKEPNGVNVTNVFMHLTNYAVNKHSRTYNQDTEGGSKRRLSWLNGYLRSLKHDVDNLWYRIDDVIIKTIISSWPVLRHSYAACFPNHDIMPACCELLGVDIILDRKLNPQILEVNHSPSFHTDTTLDSDVKENLLSDMFAMMNLNFCDKRRIIREDRKRVRDRLLHGTVKETNNSTDVKSFTEYYKLEHQNRGGFRLVYPCVSSEHTYKKFFEQGQCSLYNDTAASRAREAAQNAMRDEMVLKAKLEAAKRINMQKLPKPIDFKSRSETRSLAPSLSMSSRFSRNSFEPQMIVEAEERERIQRLAQREYLIRSNGLLEHVYFSMKKNGILRPQDEKKFAIFEKIRSSGEPLPVKTGKPVISDMLEGIRNGSGEFK
ncbi:unnamed protein product [Brassicogethes aeneus]|uniref:Uncharacterized protein n=1 Tax=Brassicogethes aeneus TaxID=1431903 RepID=A0A9P0BC29_BRAAE|nr:unnamed protein product [Brassicogethes aeneus]